MTLAPPIGFLGGTFDPIQLGHTGMASAVLTGCKLARVEFIPCYQPPHRPVPSASPEDRVAMVKLAIQHHPKFSVNTMEITAKEVSYTYKTVTKLREDYPNTPLCFMMGEDAFASFYAWDESEIILSKVHIIVVTRQGYSHQHKNFSTLETLHATLAGKMYYHEIPSIPFSATNIRTKLQLGETMPPGLDPKIANYIHTHHLYEGI